MHRIDSPGNDNGNFVDQDLNNNQPGSNTNAAWLNAIQNELVSVVEGAGLILEKTDQTQFWQAIQKTLQTNLVPVYAYADSITGANLSLSTLANNIYTPPNTVGKTHIGIVQIKPGADVPASAGEYSWREIPGKIRVRLDGLTAIQRRGSIPLTQSLNNFDKVEVVFQLTDHLFTGSQGYTTLPADFTGNIVHMLPEDTNTNNVGVAVQFRRASNRDISVSVSSSLGIKQIWGIR